MKGWTDFAASFFCVCYCKEKVLKQKKYKKLRVYFLIITYTNSSSIFIVKTGQHQSRRGMCSKSVPRRKGSRRTLVAELGGRPAAADRFSQDGREWRVLGRCGLLLRARHVKVKKSKSKIFISNRP